MCKVDLDFKPYDPTKSIFDDFLSREKLTVKNFLTGKKCEVIFRSNQNRNQLNNRSTIFYTFEEGIDVGNILQVHEDYFLVLNKLSTENRVYKFSDLVKCNTIFNGFSDGKEIVIPAFAINSSSPYGNNGNVISTLSGDVEILTQNCKLTQSVKEGIYFYAIGGRFSVKKKVEDVDGMLHIFAKAEAFTKPPTFLIEINLSEIYRSGDSARLIATAKRVESNSEAVVSNATIAWESSNEKIVSFDKNGIAKFHSEGKAEVVAIWKEHNVAETKMITVC